MSARSTVLAPTPLLTGPSAPAGRLPLLSDRLWWCRLPRPLRNAALDLLRPEPHWQWRPVRLIDAHADSCVLSLEMPGPDESSRPLLIAQDAAAILFASPA